MDFAKLVSLKAEGIDTEEMTEMLALLGFFACRPTVKKCAYPSIAYFFLLVHVCV